MFGIHRHFVVMVAALALATPVAIASDESAAADTPSNLRKLATTYVPGKLTVRENGLLLSQGLTAKLLSTAGTFVQYANGGQSDVVAHSSIDYGTTFPDERHENKGGWIYPSNAEERFPGSGSVSGYTFNKKGELIDYKRLITNTTANCGGGYTSWGSYITCEETSGGRIYQIDPTGERAPELITMGAETGGGPFESFISYDVDKTAPQFFATEDARSGVVRRFIPDMPNWEDPWTMLTGPGDVDYLLVDPSTGTYSWTTDLAAARANAETHFPNTEGIDRQGTTLYFVTKRFKSMYILDLEGNSYTNVTTLSGAFNGQPDQVIAYNAPIKKAYADKQWIFFTEDGESNAGLFARNIDGQFYTILENANEEFINDETTGLAFSPDGKHLYFGLQSAGLLYDVTRLDGRAFQGKMLNINYHVEKE